MKRVFLDTNVILDAALPVRANFVCANSILSACDNNDIQGCVSLLTIANTAYILKKGRTEKEMIQDLISIIHVFSCRIYGLRKYKNKLKGDEDVAQILQDGAPADRGTER